jgi:hypothetical protein
VPAVLKSAAAESRNGVVGIMGRMVRRIEVRM